MFVSYNINDAKELKGAILLVFFTHCLQWLYSIISVKILQLIDSVWNNKTKSVILFHLCYFEVANFLPYLLCRVMSLPKTLTSRILLTLRLLQHGVRKSASQFFSRLKYHVAQNLELSFIYDKAAKIFFNINLFLRGRLQYVVYILKECLRTLRISNLVAYDKFFWSMEETWSAA